MNTDFRNEEMTIDEMREKMKQEAQAKAIVEVAKKPEDLLSLQVSDTINHKISTEVAVKERVDKTADVIIDTGLRKQENEIKEKEGKSDLELNKEVYTHFGIDKKVVKGWKRKMYELFDDFWDLVLGITFGFTIVPVSKVLDRFTHLQNKWIKSIALIAGFVGLGAFITAVVYGTIYGVNLLKNIQ